jgi:hypothetical protein
MDEMSGKPRAIIELPRERRVGTPAMEPMGGSGL